MDEKGYLSKVHNHRGLFLCHFFRIEDVKQNICVDLNLTLDFVECLVQMFSRNEMAKIIFYGLHCLVILSHPPKSFKTDFNGRKGQIHFNDILLVISAAKEIWVTF